VHLVLGGCSRWGRGGKQAGELRECGIVREDLGDGFFDPAGVLTRVEASWRGTHKCQSACLYARENGEGWRKHFLRKTPQNRQLTQRTPSFGRQVLGLRLHRQKRMPNKVFLSVNTFLNWGKLQMKRVPTFFCKKRGSRTGTAVNRMIVAVGLVWR